MNTRLYAALISVAREERTRALFAKFISRNTERETRLKKLNDELYKMSRGKIPFDIAIAKAIDNEIYGNETEEF